MKKVAAAAGRSGRRAGVAQPRRQGAAAAACPAAATLCCYHYCSRIPRPLPTNTPAIAASTIALAELIAAGEGLVAAMPIQDHRSMKRSKGVWCSYQAGPPPLTWRPLLPSGRRTKNEPAPVVLLVGGRSTSFSSRKSVEQNTIYRLSIKNWG